MNVHHIVKKHMSELKKYNSTIEWHEKSKELPNKNGFFLVKLFDMVFCDYFDKNLNRFITFEPSVLLWSDMPDVKYDIKRKTEAITIDEAIARYRERGSSMFDILGNDSVRIL